MKASIPQTYRAALLQLPVLTPILIGLEKPEETGLAMRVPNLFSFRRAGIPISIRPVGYQGKEGTWVVVIAFGIAAERTPLMEGAVYVNPLQEDEHRLLQHLAKQERLPFLFLSPRLKVAVRQDAGWSVYHRQEVRMLLAQMGHSRPDKKPVREVDPDFERARKEFESLYSVKTLLAAHTHSDVWVSSSFRGVVLD
ncbi:MAG: hypothetical protein HYZ72_14680 [Deltaproteobacteria bacterium]|nr:hypothetical protein [Deltaproteobacteria bacterium]